jgi:hypothetical protein
MGHARAKYLNDAILKSLGKEGDPMGILIEAVLEKEFNSYEELLRDCLDFMGEDYVPASNRLNDLMSKIENKIDEGRIKSGGPISG